MAHRYIYTPTAVTSDGREYLLNPQYPIIPESTDDIYLITTEGDRYDLLAEAFYGDIDLWWIIALANNATSDDLAIQPGLQIRVPANQEQILGAYIELNRIR